MPARVSSSVTPSLAAAPKIASGRSSGVTIVVAKLDPHVVGASGGHQRELIQRQRPGHPPGRHERQAVNVAALDVLDQAVQGLVQPAVVDRERVRIAGPRMRPERQHQRVILKRLLAHGVQQPLVRLDPGELIDEQLCAGVLRDPLQG